MWFLLVMIVSQWGHPSLMVVLKRMGLDARREESK
jgi:hypothetical protein